MHVKLVQMTVAHEMAANKEKILRALRTAQKDQLVAYPEGSLSGYFPAEHDYLKKIDPNDIENAVQEIKSEVDRLKCHCLLGTAMFFEGSWFNAVVIMSHGVENRVYYKIKVGTPENRCFVAGDDNQTPVFEINGIKVGVNICRETVFPEIWSHLKKLGADVVFHINNAIKPKDNVWRHILITRAIEHDYFVCSVNNCCSPQELTSCIVAPSGKILAEAEPQKETTIPYSIDLTDEDLRIDF